MRMLEKSYHNDAFPQMSCIFLGVVPGAGVVLFVRCPVPGNVTIIGALSTPPNAYRQNFYTKEALAIILKAWPNHHHPILIFSSLNFPLY